MVSQFHECHFHGCVKCFPNDRQKIVTNGKTCDEAWAATLRRTQTLREAGYRVIEKWECEFQKTQEPLLKQQTRSYPRAIFYDFESYHDKTQRCEATAELVYENVHVPVSASLGNR